jgi:hypothetical protein
MSRLIAALLLAVSAPATVAQSTEKATFAAGCFWCAEEAFEKVPGVVSVVSGYTGGSKQNDVQRSRAGPCNSRLGGMAALGRRIPIAGGPLLADWSQ